MVLPLRRMPTFKSSQFFNKMTDLGFSGCDILLEDGFFLQQEDGGELLFEDCIQTSNLVINGWYVDSLGGMHYSYRER